MEDEVGMVLALMMFAIMILAIISLSLKHSNSIFMQQAIDRGYAAYCPTSGEFAWIGECDSDLPTAPTN